MGRKVKLDDFDLFGEGVEPDQDDADEGDADESDTDEGDADESDAVEASKEPTYWGVKESTLRSLEQGEDFGRMGAFASEKVRRGFASPSPPSLQVDGEGFLDYIEMVENARRTHVKGFSPLLAHLYKYAEGLEAYRNKWDGQVEGPSWEKVRNWPEPLPSAEDLSKYLQRRGGGAFSVRLYRDNKPLDGCIVQVEEIMTETPRKANAPEDLAHLLKGKKESEFHDKLFDIAIQKMEGGDSKGAMEAFHAYRERAINAEKRLEELEEKYESKLEKVQGQHKEEMDALVSRIEAIQQHPPKHTESDRLYGILESAIGGSKGGDSGLIAFYQQQLESERSRYSAEMRDERSRADKLLSEQRDRYEEKLKDQRDRYEDKLKDQKSLFERDLNHANARWEQEIRDLKAENKELREKLEKAERMAKSREETLQRELKDIDRSLRSLELEKVTLSMKAQQGHPQTIDPFATLDNAIHSVQRLNGALGKISDLAGGGRTQSEPEPMPQPTQASQGGLLGELGKQVINNPAVTGALGEVLGTLAKMGAGAILPSQGASSTTNASPSAIGSASIREPRTRPHASPSSRTSTQPSTTQIPTSTSTYHASTHIIATYRAPISVCSRAPTEEKGSATRSATNARDRSLRHHRRSTTHHHGSTTRRDRCGDQRPRLTSPRNRRHEDRRIQRRLPTTRTDGPSQRRSAKHR